jgi:hypothetical protein
MDPGVVIDFCGFKALTPGFRLKIVSGMTRGWLTRITIENYQALIKSLTFSSTLFIYFNACSISAIRSSTFSNPTEIRNRLSVMPAASRASGV